MQSLEKRYRAMGVVLLLAVFAAELTISVRQESLSFDEANHIFAGYLSWKRFDFGINPEHPPLVKALATLPLIPMNLKLPSSDRSAAYFKIQAYLDGRDFLFGNGGSTVANRITFRARTAAATLSLLAALLVFFAAQEMFGKAAGVFAAALFVFEPNAIAHGAYVTTDMAAACFMFAAIYALYRYVKAPSWERSILTGLAAGLALASKHSALLLLPTGFILLLAELKRLRAKQERSSLQYAGECLCAGMIAIAVLWAFYGFRYAARPDGLHLTPTLVEYVQGLKGFEPRLILSLAHWHTLPESYLFGLVDIRLLSTSEAPARIFLAKSILTVSGTTSRWCLS